MLTTIATPSSRGSAIHPLLLALYYSSPTLRKAVLANGTQDEKTLTYHVRRVWNNLASGKSADAGSVWNLIGEEALMKADARELFVQLCDLLDAENDLAAKNSFGLDVRHEIKYQSEASTARIENTYDLLLPISFAEDETKTSLKALLERDFAPEPVDYSFENVNEGLPVTAEKLTTLAGVGVKESMIFTLERYRRDFYSGGMTKIYDCIDIPESFPGGEELAKHAARGETAESVLGKCTFHLTCVVAHSEHDGYALYVRDGASEASSWFRTCHQGDHNEEGTMVAAPEGIRTVFGGDVGDETAYMLFYECRGGNGPTSARLSVKRKKSVRKDAAAVAAPAAAKVSIDVVPAASSGGEAVKKAGGGGGCCEIQ